MLLRNFLKNEKTSFILIIIGVAFTIISVLLFVWKDYHFDTSLKINSEKIGQLGDFIGGVVGSLFSLAGVILFYVALTEQRDDFQTNQKAFNLQVDALKQQIEEFKAQKEEIENSRRIYEEQSKTQRIQQFDSNFYSLLNVYLTVKDNLNNIGSNNDFFLAGFDQFKIDFDESKDLTVHHENTVTSYINYFNVNSGHLSHYFKLFYRIIKVIDSHPTLEINEKLFYSKILRSQLTDYEQLLLYYNSFTLYGEKARPYILRYNLLKHTPLFKKPEFNFFYTLQGTDEILLFSEWLYRFLAKHINESYDLNFESEKIEESCQYFDTIVGIYFDGSIQIKVYCKKDIVSNRINISEDRFADFLLKFIYDRIILASYINSSDASVSKFKTETESNKIFGVEINVTVPINLYQD